MPTGWAQLGSEGAPHKERKLAAGRRWAAGTWRRRRVPEACLSPPDSGSWSAAAPQAEWPGDPGLGEGGFPDRVRAARAEAWSPAATTSLARPPPCADGKGSIPEIWGGSDLCSEKKLQVRVTMERGERQGNTEGNRQERACRERLVGLGV